MTLEQVCEFVTLAEQRNYLIAADIMYMSQATLSRHIMSLEEELGYTLFDRSTKHIELTQEGVHFLVFARDIVRLKNSYTEALNKVRRKNSGILKVGYNYLVTLYNIHLQITNYIQENAQTKINIIEDDAKKLIEQVQNGNCDIAIIQEDPFNRIHDIDSIRLHTDCLTVVMSKESKFSSLKTIDLKLLKNKKFVTSSPEQQPVSFMFEACRRSGFEPNIAKTGFIGKTMYDWIKNNKEYIALEWKKPATEYNDGNFKIVEVEPILYFHTVLIYNKETISPLGREFIKYLKAVNNVR